MKFIFANSNKQVRSGWKMAAVMAAYILATIVIMRFAGVSKDSIETYAIKYIINS